MPNWCEGSLKVRGTKDAVKKFMMEALEPLQNELAIFVAESKGVEPPKPNQVNIICDDEWEFSISANEGFYIKGTQRNFIKGEARLYHDGEIADRILVTENFSAAWGIESAPYVELSKKYNVDFRIYGFEKGMEFNQDIEIIHGEIVKDKVIQFDNYKWDCIFPNLGG